MQCYPSFWQQLHFLQHHRSWPAWMDQQVFLSTHVGKEYSYIRGIRSNTVKIHLISAYVCFLLIYFVFTQPLFFDSEGHYIIENTIYGYSTMFKTYSFYHVFPLSCWFEDSKTAYIQLQLHPSINGMLWLPPLMGLITEVALIVHCVQTLPEGLRLEKASRRVAPFPNVCKPT